MVKLHLCGGCILVESHFLRTPQGKYKENQENLKIGEKEILDDKSVVSFGLSWKREIRRMDFVQHLSSLAFPFWQRYVPSERKAVRKYVYFYVRG